MSAKTCAGFSLLEAICSLTLIVCLITMATPASVNWIDKQRMHSLQTDFFHMAYQARAVAMTRKSRVTLCPLTDQGICSFNWSNRLSSFIDSNGNRQIDLGEEIVHVLSITETVRLNWRGMRPTNSIHFSSQGVTFVSNGTMSFCSRNPAINNEAVVINRQGRIKTSSTVTNCSP